MGRDITATTASNVSGQDFTDTLERLQQLETDDLESTLNRYRRTTETVYDQPGQLGTESSEQ